MNYLILTPDGVGSTLLQTALTIYLNAAELNYYNTPNLLTGLILKNSQIYKKHSIENTQRFDEIKSILLSTDLNLVSAIHEKNKSKLNIHDKKDYKNFYDFCNQYYKNIIYCVRDPYENALSLSISNRVNETNVYNIKQRIDVHNKDKKYSIDLDFFKKSLDEYKRYHTWVFDNFPNAIPIDYRSLNSDIDNTIKKLCNINFDIKEKFRISFNDYSKILYHVSLIKQNVSSTTVVNEILKENFKNILFFHRFQKSLINENKLFSIMPIKSNTLEDKKLRIINFHETIEIYNLWVKHSNYFSSISQEEITAKISQEKNNYKIN